MTIDTPHTIYSQEKAAEIVKQMNNDPDEEWTYEAINNPKLDGPKTAIIAIYDEDKNFIAYL